MVSGLLWICDVIGLIIDKYSNYKVKPKGSGNEGDDGSYDGNSWLALSNETEEGHTGSHEQPADSEEMLWVAIRSVDLIIVFAVVILVDNVVSVEGTSCKTEEPEAKIRDELESVGALYLLSFTHLNMILF